MKRKHIIGLIATMALLVCIGLAGPVQAAEKSPYMGGDVKLIKRQMVPSPERTF